MKRITAIELHNFLAFYDTDNKISLPKGENLLLYGENGSGKSSLCRALEVFFDAKNHPNFGVQQRNIWATPTDPPTDLRVTFDNAVVPPAAASPTIPTPVIPPLTMAAPASPPPVPPQTLDINTASGIDWVGESRLASGFLSYREMLKSHTFGLDVPNLFDLVIIDVLRGQKIGTGGKTISNNWQFVEEEIGKFLRKDWGNLKEEIPLAEGGVTTKKELLDQEWVELETLVNQFNSDLEGLLNQINLKVNDLIKYFDPDLSVKLIFVEQKDRFKNPKKGAILEYVNIHDDPVILFESKHSLIAEVVEFKIFDFLQDLCLKKPYVGLEVVFLDQPFPEYDRFLNEARLNAIACCIYFTALTLKPDPHQFKLLFLDDVLIGLDSGNRLPFLRILQDHFQDFQIIVSTYDRHWFEISKRFVTKLTGHFKWKCAELYSKEENKGRVRLVKPVLHESGSSLTHALYHFKNTHRPDYPAAVNYLRKALEETIRENLPQKELKEQTGETQDNARLLKPLLARTKTLFERIHQPTTTVDQIREKLRTLLNPLSHFEIDTPIYQNEVQEIFDLTEKLTAQFKEIKPVLKEILPQDSWIQIQFQISATEIGVFRLKHKDAIYSYNSLLSNCSFWCVETFIIADGAKGSTTRLRADIVDTYESIKDAYEKIYVFCQSGSYPNLANHPDYLDAVFVEDDGTIVPLKSKI